MKRIYVLLVLCVLSGLHLSLSAQEKSKQLFDYPQVPDTISTLENRSNYFISRFWNPLDFSKTITDKETFETTFIDYLSLIPHAHRTVVRSSISEMMYKAQSNMKNYWLFVDAAEKYIYSENAILRSDEVYVYFLKSIVSSSKVKKSEKIRYQSQLDMLNKNQVGMVAQNFSFADSLNQKKSFDDVPQTSSYILLFNDPDCSDCRLARVRISTNVIINELIDAGKLTLMCITPGEYSKEWAEKVKDYPGNWVVGASEDVDTLYDLRTTPIIYILDQDRRIIHKHVTADELVNLFNQI